MPALEAVWTSIAPTETKTLVLIDAAVEDDRTLLEGLPSDAEVAILHPAQDGIEQISQILARHDGIKALHLVSHGSPGCLYLGNSILNWENIDRYSPQIQQWRKALAPDADILLYSCHVAASGLSVDSEQLSVNREQISVNREQISVNSEQLSVNSEQSSVGIEKSADGDLLLSELHQLSCYAA